MDLDKLIGYSGYIGIPGSSGKFNYSWIEKPNIIDIYGYNELKEFEKMLVIYGYHNYEEKIIKDWIIDYCKKNNVKIPSWYIYSTEDICCIKPEGE